MQKLDWTTILLRLYKNSLNENHQTFILRKNQKFIFGSL
ncbi:hypothetical protein G436_1291 [Leptospira interrogans serovar Hardjo str. Norma]|uniref:Uncharacterized protein n=1 Tax=Leptospira interrogans serovar Hardjo str. Norma TaxID=1279460 RepID=A0A0M4N461_LEPIR|nr:hypothetical protein G436_1291 [Leptospira interrogans serovar Hardjo str. Norma]